MNKKLFCSLLTIMMVAMLSVGFASCGGNDDDNDVKTSTKDPEGTIVLNMFNGGYKNATRFHVYNVKFHIDKANNFVNDGITRFINVGKINGISDINETPTIGWTTSVAVIPGYGYIAKYNSSPEYQYIRIYVVDYITNTSNEIIGATIKYHYWYSQPWN
jgi:hypothetical protein